MARIRDLKEVTATMSCLRSVGALAVNGDSNDRLEYNAFVVSFRALFQSIVVRYTVRNER